MKVRDYMAEEVITANPRDGLYQTWERMQERDIRHMPVLGEHGELIGIITDRDIRRPRGLDEPNTVYAFAPDNHHKVADAMTPDPYVVHPDDDLLDAVTLTIDHKLGALPVVEDGRPVGILSALDLLRAFRDQLRRAPTAGGTTPAEPS